MRSLFGLTYVFAIVWGLSACNGKTETFTYADEGALCLRSNPDGTLDATVVFPPCLSSSCDRVLDTSCTITFSNNEITIASRGSYESPLYGTCTADCAPLAAECTSEEALAPGDYTLVHGEDRGGLTLPAGGVELFSQMTPLGQCECQAPLDEYCEGAECPTWDEAIAAAEEEGRQNAGDPSCIADAGPCEEVRWVRRSRGTRGYVTEYFDFSGELVAAIVSSDTVEFCSNSSGYVRHGPDVASGCLPGDDFCR